MDLRLPKQIERYIASLSQIYKINGNKSSQKILVNASIEVEEHSYDRWDGGQYGFLLRLKIPDIIFAEIVNTKNEYEQDFLTKLNDLIKISGEFLDCVSIEMQLSEDDDWRKKTGMILPSKGHIPESDLERIWKPTSVRAFISHKAKYKIKVSKLKDQLEKFGISCFVAHKDIEPTKEWIQEIENALFSMDLLIALMTDDFHDSAWTDQEVGVAVGRHVPVIPVKLGKDPYGFIGKYQALSGTLTDIAKIASDVFAIIVKNPITKEKAELAAVDAFKIAFSYDNSKFLIKEVLPHFKKLRTSHVSEIIKAFNHNSQLYDCFFVRDNLPALLYGWTGEQYHFNKKNLIKTKPRNALIDDDIPF